MTATVAFLLLLAQQVPPVAPMPPYREETDQPSASFPEPLPQERGALPHLGRAMQASDPKVAIENFDLALGQLPQPTGFRGMVQCMRGGALMHDEQQAQAEAAIDECYRLLPGHPATQMTRAMLYMEKGDFVRAAPLIATAIGAAPNIREGFPVQQAGVVLSGLDYARRDDVREQFVRKLVEAGYGKDDPTFYSGIAREAVLDRVRRRDISGAVALLPGITDPEDGLMMLIDRRFDAIWPQLEEWAHTDLAVQRDMLVRQARAAADVAGTPEARLGLTGVLERTGHRAEAKRLLAETMGDTALWDDFRFAVGLSAVRLSRLMVEDGSEGDAAVQPMLTVLGDAPITRETGGLHTVTPNLARRYVLQGRFDRALEVVDRYTPQADDINHANDIGFMLAMRTCALHGKGDKAAAARARSELMTRYAANVAANGMASKCVGDLRNLAADLEQSLAEERKRSAILLSIARARRRVSQGLPAVEDSLGGKDVDALYVDPALLVVFERYGRALPASFLPALDQWQTPLDAAPDAR